MVDKMKIDIKCPRCSEHISMELPVHITKYGVKLDAKLVDKAIIESYESESEGNKAGR